VPDLKKRGRFILTATPPGLARPEFDAMAKWYDFDYDRRVRKDIPFYLDCAREGGNPVLELGAGTGRVTRHLVRAGFAVTGLEVSRRMLERARVRLSRLREARGSWTLLEGDMAKTAIRKRFATVLVPFRAFHHLYTVDRQLAALRLIRTHLRPDGLAVIDLFHPDIPEFERLNGRLVVAYDRKGPEPGTRVVQRFRMTCDFPRQMGAIDYYWDVYQGRRRLSRDHAPMRWRWFHRYEFEHLLARAGLRTARVVGDFDGRPYDSDSEEMVFFVNRA
jgi:SAM-dependent methyltransferase